MSLFTTIDPNAIDYGKRGRQVTYPWPELLDANAAVYRKYKRPETIKANLPRLTEVISREEFPDDDDHAKAVDNRKQNFRQSLNSWLKSHGHYDEWRASAGQLVPDADGNVTVWCCVVPNAKAEGEDAEEESEDEEGGVI